MSQDALSFNLKRLIQTRFQTCMDFKLCKWRDTLYIHCRHVKSSRGEGKVSDVENQITQCDEGSFHQSGSKIIQTDCCTGAECFRT